jgi:hypothetical protein
MMKQTFSGEIVSIGTLSPADVSVWLDFFAMSVT